MKTLRCGLLISVVIANGAVAATDKSIDYKATTAMVNAKSILSLHRCLWKSDCEGFLGDTLECGPFLWQRLKNSPALTNMAMTTQFNLPQNQPGGGSKIVTMNGARFQGAEHVRAFWKTFCEAIPPAELKKIRWLKDPDCRIYWALTRKPIQEPVFIVEDNGHKILMQIVVVREHYILTFIDDLKDVTIRD